MNERKYRMYGLVPYNISPIQQGIQYGHAVVEYGLTYGNTEEYQRWSRNDKTFIILNGGTTNTNHLSLGTLNQHASALEMLCGIDTAKFYEQDLGDQLTAVVFLVDDRVWDNEKFNDYDDYRIVASRCIDINTNLMMSVFAGNFTNRFLKKLDAPFLELLLEDKIITFNGFKKLFVIGITSYAVYYSINSIIS